jgi:5-methylcytosine-specific restriction endonuclease McrA
MKRCSEKERCIHPESKEGWLPSTEQYFHKSKNHKTGLAPRCKLCAIAASKAHYAANTEVTLKRRKERYWKAPEKARAAVRAYNEEHAEEIKRRRRELHAANPTPKRESDRRYYKKARHKIREKQIRWEHENPHKKQAISHRYSARKRELPHDFTGEDWQRALNYFGGCCAYCGTPPGLWNRLTAEHFIPVTKGGGTIPTNIIPACQSCNSSKHDSYIDDWLPRKFGKRRAARIMAVIQSYFESLR